MLLLIFVLGIFGTSYKVTIDGKESKYAAYEWNKVLFGDLKDEISYTKAEIGDIEEHIEELEEFGYENIEFKILQENVQEELDMSESEVKLMSKIYKINIAVCIVLILTLINYVYSLVEAYDTKKKIMISGMLFSVVNIATIIVNRVMIKKMLNVGAVRYGEEILITSTVLGTVLIVLSAINMVTSIVFGIVSTKKAKAEGKEKCKRGMKILVSIPIFAGVAVVAVIISMLAMYQGKETVQEIPEGCQYVVASTGETLEEGDEFPRRVKKFDEFYTENYIYTYKDEWYKVVDAEENVEVTYSTEYWHVRVNPEADSPHEGILDEEILSSIAEKPVTDMYLFRGTGSHCLVEVEKLPEIPDSVKSIASAFSGCANLTEAPEIPDSVINMDGAFSGCTSLTEAPEIPDSVTTMNSAFADCISLTETPEISNGVVDMGYAFSRCTSLTKASKIPDSVTNMNGAFQDCTSLIEAPKIPNGLTDMGNAFSRCTSLTKAPEIPSSVTNMDGAFQGCIGLTEAPKIPDGVEIWQGVFEGCVNLPEVKNNIYTSDYTYTKFTSEYQHVEDVVVNGTQDMFMTDDGYMYIIDDNRRIVIGTKDGKLDRIIDDSCLGNPKGVYVVDNEENGYTYVYVADSEIGSDEIESDRKERKKNGMIHVFRFKKTIRPEIITETFVAGNGSTWEEITVDYKVEYVDYYLKSDMESYDEEDRFVPEDIIVCEDGYMYVILKGNKNGILKCTQGEGDNFVGYFADAVKYIDIALGEDGNIYTIVDLGSSEYDIIIYDYSGEKIKQISCNNYNCTDIVPKNDGGFYILDGNGSIVEYNAAGEMVEDIVDIVSQRTIDPMFCGATAMCLDAEGNLYMLADYETGRILVFETEE